MDRFAGDERGVSESTGVAILIAMTVVVTATVGLNVLLVTDEDNEGPSADFTYDHVSDMDALVIQHAGGDEFPAGDLVIEGPSNEVTWAEVAGDDPESTAAPGDIVQLSSQNAYDDRVTSRDTVTIYYDGGENRTQLSQWPEE